MKTFISFLFLSLCAAPAVAETLRIGTESDFKPHIFWDENGARTGFDPEFMEAVCTAGAFDCEWIEMPFDELFTGLADGLYDIAVGGIGDTPQRAKYADWTDSYRPLESGVSTLVAFSRDFDPATAKVSVQAGTKQHDLLLNEGFVAVPYPSNTAAFEALKQGEVDVFFAANSYIFPLSQAEPDLWNVGELTYADGGVQIAVRKGQPELRAKLNGIIAGLIENGTVALLEARWFPNNTAQDG